VQTEHSLKIIISSVCADRTYSLKIIISSVYADRTYSLKILLVASQQSELRSKSKDGLAEESG